MNDVVSLLEAIKVADQREHLDVLDAMDFGDATLETKQAGPKVTPDSSVGGLGWF